MDAVTMHSRVLVRDLNSGIESSYTPVFPQDADIAQSKISILVPIATVLLGYRGGDEIEWPTPGGRRRLKIVKVLYQPEAAGDEPEHSVALYRQSRERDELTSLKSPLNEQESLLSSVLSGTATGTQCTSCWSHGSNASELPSES
jgi:Transcription elongation factor, GreA/GreB, C-term